VKLSGGQYFWSDAWIVNSVRSCAGLDDRARGIIRLRDYL
jgi:hypothetical protein